MDQSRISEIGTADHADQTDSKDREIGKPLQFRLIDLFALMTLGALILAMAAPLLRQIRSEDRWTLVGILCGQAILITIVMLVAANKRKALLEVSGRRIGVGYCGDSKWRHWPVAKCLLIMLFVAAAQMAFSLGMLAYTEFLLSPGILIQQFQLGLIFGLGCSRYIWRVLPNSLEFFENGISLDGTSLIRWDRVTVRDSKFFPDRIVVVVRIKPKSIEADTQVVQVTDRLRQKITTICTSTS